MKNNVIFHRKNPLKRIKKKNVNKSDTKVESLKVFTERILKVAYDITIDNHHRNHANSIETVSTKLNKTSNDINFCKKIMKEIAVLYTNLLNQ